MDKLGTASPQLTIFITKARKPENTKKSGLTTENTECTERRLMGKNLLFSDLFSVDAVLCG
jgi:hypothetical protein